MICLGDCIKYEPQNDEKSKNNQGSEESALENII